MNNKKTAVFGLYPSVEGAEVSTTSSCNRRRSRERAGGLGLAAAAFFLGATLSLFGATLALALAGFRAAERFAAGFRAALRVFPARARAEARFWGVALREAFLVRDWPFRFAIGKILSAWSQP